jgi:soluble lytic murein transglycosylase-like protein
MTAELLAALIAVESGGNDLARGRHGELGALQVRPCVVKDVNRVVGGNYRWSEMTNRVTATRVARAYLDHWGSPSRLGRKPTDRDLARVWHGGPNGWKRRQTLVYWKRVRARIMQARMGAS